MPFGRPRSADWTVSIRVGFALHDDAVANVLAVYCTWICLCGCCCDKTGPDYSMQSLEYGSRTPGYPVNHGQLLSAHQWPRTMSMPGGGASSTSKSWPCHVIMGSWHVRQCAKPGKQSRDSRRKTRTVEEEG